MICYALVRSQPSLSSYSPSFLLHSDELPDCSYSPGERGRALGRAPWGDPHPGGSLRAALAQGGRASGTGLHPPTEVPPRRGRPV